MCSKRKGEKVRRYSAIVMLIMAFGMLFGSEAGNKMRMPVDTLSTLSSFKEKGDFCVIDYQGDYDPILENLNNSILGQNADAFSDFNCSLFSAIGDSSRLFYGRNFDNPACDVLVGRYSLNDHYKTLVFNRMSDMGIPMSVDYSNMSNTYRNKLLKAPFFATDGINETGLCAGLAYVPGVTVIQDPGKPKIFITYLLRKILDEASNCNEALAIANSYNVFDSGNNFDFVQHHILVSDRMGNSIILEHNGQQYVSIVPENDWQVLTNSVMLNIPHEVLMDECWRYNLLHTELMEVNGICENWRTAMDILALPTWGNTTNGTQWSVISDINQAGVYIAIDRKFGNVAYANIEDFDFINFGEYEVLDINVTDANDDGILQVGETVNLSMHLNSNFNAYGITAVLSCPNQYVNIEDSIAVFSDIIESNAVNNYDNPFVLSTDYGFTETSLLCYLDIRTSYNYAYRMPVYLPMSFLGQSDNVATVDKLKCSIYPNPFNPRATINWTQSEDSRVNVSVYNSKGQKVKDLRDDFYRKGNHQILWDSDSSGNLSSGIYFVRIKTDNAQKSNKVMLIK